MARFARLRLAAACILLPLLAAHTASCPNRKVRSRRRRQDHQDRHHGAAERPGLRLRADREIGGGLFPQGQRRRRRQRTAHPDDHRGRCLQPAEDGRADAAAGRERRGAADLRRRRHADQQRRAQISQRPARCRNSSSARARRSGTIRRIFRGPSAGSRPIATRRSPTRSTSRPAMPMRRSACSTRTTISARTI